MQASVRSLHEFWLRAASKDERQGCGLMVLLAMPTGRANARPMTGSASSRDAYFCWRRSLTASRSLGLLRRVALLAMRVECEPGSNSAAEPLMLKTNSALGGTTEISRRARRLSILESDPKRKYPCRVSLRLNRKPFSVGMWARDQDAFVSCRKAAKYRSGCCLNRQPLCQR
jgi:hypothetical protein